MTSGGSSFEYTDNTVAAKISIDVPQEGIQGLREITTEVERFKTQMEAANRLSGSFIDYLKQLPQIAKQAADAQKNLADQLERTVAAQGKLGGTGSITQSGVQPGPQQLPLPGMENLDRQYMNKQAQTGRLKPGDLPKENNDDEISHAAKKHQDREKATSEQHKKTLGGMDGLEKSVKEIGNVAGDVMGQMGKGGSPAGMLQSISGGLKRLSAAVPTATAGDAAVAAGGVASDSPGFLAGMGGAAGGLGAAGAGLGAAAAGLYAFEKGGNVVQGMRQMGEIRGGGAKEGAAAEMDVQMMALNPFITTEQSRQIIQGALTGGYSGKQFDTVTQFVANNLKDMNMQISDSFGLVTKNVNEGGQSIQSLAVDLGTLKDMTKTGALSMPNAQDAFQTANSALTGAGPSGTAASSGALQASAMWKDDLALQGQGSKNLAGVMASPAASALLQQSGVNLPPGVSSPRAIKAYLELSNQATQASSDVIKKFAIQAWNGSGKPPKSSAGDKTIGAYVTAVGQFQSMAEAAGINAPFVSDPALAMKEFDSYIYSGTDPAKAAQDSVDKTVTEDLKVTKPSFLSQQFRGAGADFSSGGDAAATNFGGASNRIAVLDNVVKSTPGGAANIDVINEKGDAIKLNMNDDSQAAKLSSGEYKVRPKGGVAQTLSEIGHQGGQVAGQGDVNVTGELHISADPGLRATPNPVPISGNKVNAYGGKGTASVNQPSLH